VKTVDSKKRLVYREKGMEMNGKGTGTIASVFSGDAIETQTEFDCQV